MQVATTTLRLSPVMSFRYRAFLIAVLGISVLIGYLVYSSHSERQPLKVPKGAIARLAHEKPSKDYVPDVSDLIAYSESEVNRFGGRRRERCFSLEMEQQMILDQMGGRGILERLTLQPLPWERKIVHLDLKGAPPLVSYYDQFFAMIRSLGATGVLIEYEDMFPFAEPIKALTAGNAYTLAEIEAIVTRAKMHHLEVIPLVQTFGHLEFVLKLEEYGSLREVHSIPQAVCPSNNATLSLLRAMIDQVVEAHPGLQYLHLGCDEVAALGECSVCRRRMQHHRWDKDRLFLEHIKYLVEYVKKVYPNVQPIVWDDMFRHVDLAVLRDSELPSKVDIMVWDYTADITRAVPDVIWMKYEEAHFHGVWAASAFKGATGADRQIVPLEHHVLNHYSWQSVISRYWNRLPIRGIVLTGWQRYNHFTVLCELLPVGIPSLALNLVYLRTGALNSLAMEEVQRTLGCNRRLPLFDKFIGNGMYSSNGLIVCQFPGSNVFTALQQYDEIVREKDIMERHPLFTSALHRYNARFNFSNPDMVLSASRNLSSIVFQTKHLLTTMDATMGEMFDKHTPREWIDTFLVPIATRLREIQQTVERLGNCEYWPRRPLPEPEADQELL